MNIGHWWFGTLRWRVRWLEAEVVRPKTTDLATRARRWLLPSVPTDAPFPPTTTVASVFCAMPTRRAVGCQGRLSHVGERGASSSTQGLVRGWWVRLGRWWMGAESFNATRTHIFLHLRNLSATGWVLSWTAAGLSVCVRRMRSVTVLLNPSGFTQSPAWSSLDGTERKQPLVCR